MTDWMKPCPLCGGKPHLKTNAEVDWWITCTGCGLYFPGIGGAVASATVECWNTRRPISAEEVREAGELLREECKAVFGSTWNYDNTWRFVKTVARALGHEVEEDE